MQIFKRDTKPGNEMALALAEAVDAAQAIVWLDADGKILSANANFLRKTGYSAGELAGADHSILLDPQERDSDSYRKMWQSLRAGERQSGNFRRRSKDGREIWVEAVYVPLRNSAGKVDKVVKFSTDITERKNQSLDAAGKIEAISRSHAVIEFEPDGKILTANENFLELMGYKLEEIVGKEHQMFVHRDYAGSTAYKAFWRHLAEGNHKTASFKRFTKDGRGVWIQATYAPIVDAFGKVLKVVKFATDVTEVEEMAGDARGKIEAISRGQAMIEFTPDGKILTANEIFLTTFGYGLEAIQGRHHSMFVPESEATGETYAQMWARLARGEIVSGEFRRIAADGREVWIYGAYNPFVDRDGNIVKVVKFASDITERRHSTDEMARGLTALANGAHRVRMSDAVTGDFAALRDAFNAAMESREELLEAIIESGERMLTEAQEVAEIASDLSRRAESQAATLEETAAAMEEMSATVRSTAGNADGAANSAQSAADQAGDGQRIVSETVDAMDRIEDGSRKISSIIETINSIAFQTNLLALNAGVEAARAGQAGSGFAVVANEVRGLAQRSSEAAKDIEALILQNTGFVADGSAKVTATGEMLGQIKAAVDDVVGNVSDISRATGEQASGIRDISSATTSMDQTTQQTARLAEASATSASALAERARGLLDLVSAITGSVQEQEQPGKAA